MRWLVACTLLIPLSVGCASSALRRARAENTPAAYHRFLRDHPNSRHAEEARQRLEIARIAKKPLASAYHAFLERWPSSPLRKPLQEAAQEAVFAEARAAGTLEAYRAFLRDFRKSDFAARARGNLAFLEANGFDGDPRRLLDFAKRHSASDFAAEARRSAAAVGVRAKTAFRRAGLVIELSGPAPGRQRLARAFSEHAAASLGSVGIELVGLAGPDDPRGAGLPAIVRIRHGEGPVSSKLAAGRLSSRGFEAKTRVDLLLRGESSPVWSRTTRFRAAAPPGQSGASVIFGPGTQRYWQSFFVPVAGWNTARTVRTPLGLEAPAVAIETSGHRAFVLFEDGSFQGVELADPEKPWVFATHQREGGGERFDGLRVVEPGVAIFGPDGVEIFELLEGRARAVRRIARGTIGTIHALETFGADLVAAGTRGVWWIPAEGEPRRLVDRPVVGLARVGDHLLLSIGNAIYVATPAGLAAGKVTAELSLGAGVRPGRMHASGSQVVVLAEVGALRIDASRPAAPRVVSRIDSSRVGAVRDAAWLGDRVFLLGERGLQVTDPSGTRVVDSADVKARERLGVLGRHVALAGKRWLQVADATPFLAPLELAAPTR